MALESNALPCLKVTPHSFQPHLSHLLLFLFLLSLFLSPTSLSPKGPLSLHIIGGPLRPWGLHPAMPSEPLPVARSASELALQAFGVNSLDLFLNTTD